MIDGSSSAFILAMMRARLPARALRASARICSTRLLCIVNGDCQRWFSRIVPAVPVSSWNTWCTSSQTFSLAVSRPKSVYNRAVRGW
ncbi:hypothetical protein D3C87_1488300 [compost metagenome]